MAQNQTNKANSAEYARTYNAEEAQKQRDWETEMSNTQYQRQMADMQAAGLNPILGMMSGGGASSGSGAQASLSPGKQRGSSRT